MRSALVLIAMVLFVPEAGATVYAGNGNTGFGGAVGLSALEISDDGSTLYFELTKGSTSLADFFVLYLDSVEGGFADTTGMLDQQDEHRMAASGCAASGCSDVAFGFQADYALVLDAASGGFLFALAEGGSGSLVFVEAAGGAGSPSNPTFSFSVSLASLGLSPGQSLDFVATYTDASASFLSNEGYGDGLPDQVPGNSGVSFTGHRSYTTLPEPANPAWAGMLSLALLRLARGRRRAGRPTRR